MSSQIEAPTPISYNDHLAFLAASDVKKVNNRFVASYSADNLRRISEAHLETHQTHYRKPGSIDHFKKALQGIFSRVPTPSITLNLFSLIRNDWVVLENELTTNDHLITACFMKIVLKPEPNAVAYLTKINQSKVRIYVAGDTDIRFLDMGWQYDKFNSLRVDVDTGCGCSWINMYHKDIFCRRYDADSRRKAEVYELVRNIENATQWLTKFSKFISTHVPQHLSQHTYKHHPAAIIAEYALPDNISDMNFQRKNMP